MAGVFGYYGRCTDLSDLGSSSSQTSRAESQARRATEQVKYLEANLGKMMLICEAMWELLSEKTGITLDEFHKKLYEVDMRDGVLDGKNQRAVVNCPSCNRPVSGKHPACLYCGHEINDSVFRLD